MNRTPSANNRYVRTARPCGYGNVAYWHEAELAACPLSGRYRVNSGHRANRAQQARFIASLLLPYPRAPTA